MILVAGLLLVVAAVAAAVLGLSGIGVPADRAFLFGLDVGVVGMVGVAMVRGDLRGRRASRVLRRVRARSVSDLDSVVRDRNRLALELAESRADRRSPSPDDPGDVS